MSCKGCTALTAMLQRNLGGLPQDLTLMDRDAQMSFFRTCLQMRDDTSSAFSYSKVRAILKNSMVQRFYNREKDSIVGEWQPLSFWKQRGYDVDAIEANAPKEKHDIFGDV